MIIMVDAHKENSFTGGGSRTRSGVVNSKVGRSKENGSVSGSDAETGSSGLGGRCMLTYKRRRIVKVVEQDMVSDDADTQFIESMKSSLDQVIQENSHASASHDCLPNHQKNIVLERICQSLETEGGLKKCIQDALAFHPGSGSRNTIKESVHPHKARSKCTFQTGSVPDRLHIGVKRTLDITSNQSTSESNHDRVAQRCQCTLFDIIMSEQFAQLCSLFLENGMKAEKLFDLSHVNSRMTERVYESSPMLFHSDMQQVWTKLQRLGNDIISLVKCLSDKTMTSFREQVGSSGNSISEDGRHEFLTQEYDTHKAEPTQACAIDQVHTCRHCEEKIDGRNGLVCDSCEEMYHLSCIEPPVKEIPVRSWYCAKCSGKGIESPHDDCVACERLNASRSNLEDELVYEEAPEELAESSNELVANEGDNNKRFPLCKSCRMEVKNDEDYRICGHSFCEDKFYHVKCLTSKQLMSYGPCWYCPSCLCRACFVDRDDDKIVLCDGCDHAYHIYCMDPPRETIPKGKWFCTKCDVGIQRVLKAKQMYESMQNKSRKRSLDGEVKTVEALNKSGGGMDMLLNAAKTLNYEENLAANGLKVQ